MLGLEQELNLIETWGYSFMEWNEQKTLLMATRKINIFIEFKTNTSSWNWLHVENRGLRTREGKHNERNEILINKININRMYMMISMCVSATKRGKFSTFNVLSCKRKINFIPPCYVNNQISRFSFLFVCSKFVHDMIFAFHSLPTAHVNFITCYVSKQFGKIMIELLKQTFLI